MKVNERIYVKYKARQKHMIIIIIAFEEVT